jgi:hypothetical protein
VNEKDRARYLLNSAVRRGEIVRPLTCSLCQFEGRIEGHHEAYDRPLDVEWLCKPCHLTRHGRQPKVRVERKRIKVAPGFWSIDDVADWLAVKVTTVRDYTRLRGLPCWRIGQRLYFDPAKVCAWMKRSPDEAA